MASTYQFHGKTLPASKGIYTCRLTLEPMWLASGSYFWHVVTSLTNVNWDHNVSHAFEFDVPFSNPLGREFDFKQVYGYGAVALLSSSPVRFDAICPAEPGGAPRILPGAVIRKKS